MLPTPQWPRRALASRSTSSPVDFGFNVGLADFKRPRWRPPAWLAIAGYCRGRRGSHLARLMSEVMVKAVLDRIPDYRVELDGVYQYLGNPSMTGLGKLPVTFTPGVKRS